MNSYARKANIHLAAGIRDEIAGMELVVALFVRAAVAQALRMCLNVFALLPPRMVRKVFAWYLGNNA